MSNIEQNLKDILEAQYGRDVRQSIHDGIRACYDDGKAGSIDLTAREQIAQLIKSEAPVDADAELTDIRTATDGYTYDTAGDAVRASGNSIFKIRGKNTKFHTSDTNEVTGSIAEVSPGDFIMEWTRSIDTKAYAYSVLGQLYNIKDVGVQYYCIVIKNIGEDVISSVEALISTALDWGPSARYNYKTIYNISPGETVFIKVRPPETLAGRDLKPNLIIRDQNIANNGKTNRIKVFAFLDNESPSASLSKADKDILLGNILNIRKQVPNANVCNLYKQNEKPTSGDSITNHVFRNGTLEVSWDYGSVDTRYGYVALSYPDLPSHSKLTIFVKNTGNRTLTKIGAKASSGSNWSPSTTNKILFTDKHIAPGEIIRIDSNLSGLSDDMTYLLFGIISREIPAVSFKFFVLFDYDDSDSIFDDYYVFPSIPKIEENEPEPTPEKERYITAWGDSLTAMGGWTSTLQSLSGLTVYNGGTGGENSATIIARQGADIMTINNITIPASGSVLIASRNTDTGISTEFGKKVTPLLQGGAHVNPVKIGDIEGTLTWTGSAYNDNNGTWTFTRSEAGDPVLIDRPTAIRTAYDRNRNDPYLMVIFIGQNGGYSDLDDLVRQHRLMIEHANAEHVIILGLSSGTASQRADYEARMKKEFGRYFLSLREYLSTPIYSGDEIVSCYGMADQDVEIDPDYTFGGKTTKKEIAEGTVPHQILSDGVHYTTGTRTVIGNYIYKKCCELNIFPVPES